MKEKILETATEMFLNLGFKSVTMDDIASTIGVSKKTIYTHFKTKNKLVEASVNHIFLKISNGIQEISNQKKDPIEELFEVHKFVNSVLKNEKTSPQYQLQKYYPKIHDSTKCKRFELVQCCIVDNLERGIATGNYRKEIPVNFISKLHYIGGHSIKNNQIFQLNEYNNHQLMMQFLEYHLRAIVTPKGLKKLEKFIPTNDATHEK